MARTKQTVRKPQTGGLHNKPVFKAFYTKSNGAPMKPPVVFLKNRPLAKNKKPTANDVTAGDIGGSSSSSSHSLSDTAAKKAMKLHAHIQRFELDDLTVTDLRTLCRSFTMNAKGTKKKQKAHGQQGQGRQEHSGQGARGQGRQENGSQGARKNGV